VYRNDGNGVFANINAGLTPVGSAASHGAAWGDFDNDGDLDILSTGCINGCSLPTENVAILYRNDSGVFEQTGEDLPGVRLRPLSFRPAPLQISDVGWVYFDP